MLRSGPPRPGTDRPAGHGKAGQGLDLLLVLGAHPKAGAIADVRVRRAVNHAIDKAAYRDAIAGRYPATGELASTLLAPSSLGYRHDDLSPTPGGHGAPAKARALLADAGYPNGLTLSWVTWGSGKLAAGTTPIEASLAKAGIRLKVKTYERGDLWERSLQLPAKRLEHQLGQSVWRPDYLGDNARQSIPLQYDSRLTDAGNYSEYHNPAANRLIDRTLAEPHRVGRATRGPGSTSGSCGTRPWSRCSGRTSRSPWPPGATAGPTTPGRSGPTSPPCGWTPRTPDGAISPEWPSRRGDPSQQHQAAYSQRPARVACGLDTAAQARSHLLGHDLDDLPGATVFRGPALLLEPAEDRGPGRPRSASLPIHPPR
jgi:Bacterial extracellular solute-binding proteins, family 5 Middle